MADQEIMSILRSIKEQLNRIEERQITVSEELKEAPVQGSFATTDNAE